MKLIGLAGKIGSGKSYVADILQRRGWRVLDLDTVAQRALKVFKDEIVQAFGSDILVNGHIDRKRLAAKVFTGPRCLEKLEAITYRWIEDETRRWIDLEPAVPAVIHAVNLHKTSLPKICDAIIWVKASRHIRKHRVIQRNHQSWERIKGRFDSQKRLRPKLFAPHAEIYSVRNSGNDASLNSSLNRIFRRLYGLEG